MKNVILRYLSFLLLCIGISCGYAQTRGCSFEELAKHLDSGTPEFRKFMNDHPDALDIYDDLFKNNSKFVLSDAAYLKKLSNLNSEVRKHIVAFTDDKAGSTFAKFLDDCDNSAFREAVNNNPILAEAFVGHKNNWTKADYEALADDLDLVTTDTKTQDLISNWMDRSGKITNFGNVVKLGREFEALCLNQLKSKSSKVYIELKNKITDLDNRTILSGVELCLSGKHPCNGAGEYFKPDFVAVKKVIRGGEETLDIIIIDSKLSKISPWTQNQKIAQGINDYVIKFPGEKLQGNIDLIKESTIQRDHPFVKIYKENEIIKVE